MLELDVFVILSLLLLAFLSDLDYCYNIRYMPVSHTMRIPFFKLFLLYIALTFYEHSLNAIFSSVL